MALYVDIHALAGDSTLRSRVAVACVIAANTIRTEDIATAKHTERMAWAKAVYASPETEASRVLWSVLAQNAGLTVAQINAADDAALQTAVTASLSAFL
jgi:exosome complex RNA-binding protein Rrp42 (RNase PH superfamily)